MFLITLIVMLTVVEILKIWRALDVTKVRILSISSKTFLAFCIILQLSLELLFHTEFVSSYHRISTTINNKQFPSTFLFGVGSSSLQIEGAWNTDGKTQSMWDNYTHSNPGYVLDNGTFDVSCDSYNKWKDDIEILKELGVNHYRFSISWTRILPLGNKGPVNPLGIAYYKNLIRTLKQNKIIPVVTILHWDLPQCLQDLGGILNSSFADWFENYARNLFKNFGDDVPFWLTINEPKMFCSGGYGMGTFPPKISSSGNLEYLCTHNMLLAHSRVYRLYEREFKSQQKGKISIVLDSHWFAPANENSIEDRKGVETVYQFEMGWQANPLYYGDYPEIMKTRIAARSAAEGRNKSRLPVFTEEEKVQVKGSVDFFAFNTYTGELVEAIEDPPVTNPPNRYGDIGVRTFQPPEWENSTISWLKVAPYGMRLLLNWIKNAYGNPDIFIIENGYPDAGDINDTKRINYHKSYLSYTRDAMEDGVNVIGYTVWSMMDNIEWNSGYKQKFGLYHVDFNNDSRNRTAKASTKWYAGLCATKCLTDTCINNL